MTANSPPAWRTAQFEVAEIANFDGRLAEHELEHAVAGRTLRPCARRCSARRASRSGRSAGRALAGRRVGLVAQVMANHQVAQAMGDEMDRVDAVETADDRVQRLGVIGDRPARGRIGDVENVIGPMARRYSAILPIDAALRPKPCSTTTAGPAWAATCRGGEFRPAGPGTRRRCPRRGEGFARRAAGNGRSAHCAGCASRERTVRRPRTACRPAWAWPDLAARRRRATLLGTGDAGTRKRP